MPLLCQLPVGSDNLLFLGGSVTTRRVLSAHKMNLRILAQVSGYHTGSHVYSNHYFVKLKGGFNLLKMLPDFGWSIVLLDPKDVPKRSVVAVVLLPDAKCSLIDIENSLSACRIGRNDQNSVMSFHLFTPRIL